MSNQTQGFEEPQKPTGVPAEEAAHTAAQAPEKVAMAIEVLWSEEHIESYPSQTDDCTEDTAYHGIAQIHSQNPTVEINRHLIVQRAQSFFANFIENKVTQFCDPGYHPYLPGTDSNKAIYESAAFTHYVDLLLKSGQDTQRQIVKDVAASIVSGIIEVVKSKKEPRDQLFAVTTFLMDVPLKHLTYTYSEIAPEEMRQLAYDLLADIEQAIQKEELPITKKELLASFETVGNPLYRAIVRIPSEETLTFVQGLRTEDEEAYKSCLLRMKEYFHPSYEAEFVSADRSGLKRLSYERLDNFAETVGTLSQETEEYLVSKLENGEENSSAASGSVENLLTKVKKSQATLERLINNLDSSDMNLAVTSALSLHPEEAKQYHDKVYALYRRAFSRKITDPDADNALPYKKRLTDSKLCALIHLLNLNEPGIAEQLADDIVTAISSEFSFIYFKEIFDNVTDPETRQRVAAILRKSDEWLARCDLKILDDSLSEDEAKQIRKNLRENEADAFALALARSKENYAASLLADVYSNFELKEKTYASIGKILKENPSDKIQQIAARLTQELKEARRQVHDPNSETHQKETDVKNAKAGIVFMANSYIDDLRSPYEEYDHVNLGWLLECVEMNGAESALLAKHLQVIDASANSESESIDGQEKRYVRIAKSLVYLTEDLDLDLLADIVIEHPEIYTVKTWQLNNDVDETILEGHPVTQRLIQKLLVAESLEDQIRIGKPIARFLSAQ